MPLYEFQCEKCQQTKEKILPYNHEEVKCECGQNMVKTINNFKSVAHGLPNGHHGIKQVKR